MLQEKMVSTSFPINYGDRAACITIKWRGRPVMEPYHSDSQWSELRLLDLNYLRAESWTRGEECLSVDNRVSFSHRSTAPLQDLIGLVISSNPSHPLPIVFLGGELKMYEGAYLPAFQGALYSPCFPFHFLLPLSLQQAICSM